VLVETTELPLAEIAFAAGFASIRQFNDTVRLVFATTPSTLRAAAVARGGMGTPGTLTLRLPVRPPFDGRGLLRLLATKSVPGVEHVDETSYHRALDLPHGEGVVTLTPREDHVGCVLRVNDPRDVVPAVARCRRLLDLDADAAAIDEQLGADPLLKPLVTAWPGVRVVGAVDGGGEMAIRAVIGQQVSVAGARTVAARLASVHGKPLTSPDAHITRHFPSAEALAEADPESLPMPRSRGRALVTVCAAIAEGRIDLDAGADREEATRALLALPGIGPWTADYVRLRALGDPDVMLASDLGVRRALERRGQPGDPRSVAARAQAWRPWRSYALMHLWHVITDREIS
jgi:AraC family transcriptional regulator of adaptative response / DNA-3-methyladenine glycosylase II